LNRFFSRNNCPAKVYLNEFLQAADRNRLDWRLLPSLSWVETGGGKAAANNNLFGWACGRAKFDSHAAGIEEVGFNLANMPLYKGKNTDQILAIYNTNPAYAVRVKSVMQQIAPSE